MAEIVSMPKMSDTMTEGVIAKWHKNVGDTVKTGELVAEIETDKATMDYESYHTGTILYLGGKEGETIQVDNILAIIGKQGEDYKTLLTDSGSNGEEKTTASKDEEKTIKTPVKDTSDVKAEIGLMPKMSDTMAEGIIAKWHKKTGDPVKSGELLAEIETDKATMDYESYHTGVLLYRGAEEQQAIPVNDVLTIIGEKGADWQALLEAHLPKEGVDSPAEKSTKEEKPSTAQPDPVEDAPKQTAESRIKASPLAKKIAHEKGYDLSDIKGSGDGGRVIKRDVENYSKSLPDTAQQDRPATILPTFVGEELYEDVPLSQSRKTIARRLSESKFSAPHFYLTTEINMDRTIEARKNINEIASVKISFNDIITKAAAASLRRHIEVNVSWMSESIRKNNHIHIGIAVAAENGLVVPVVRFTDNKSLSHIATEIKDAARKANEKKLQPSDMEGSTFTISNLGMFGIEQFTAIINPPNACILAVGGIQQKAIVQDGKVVPGHTMKVTLSCDHRAVDGAMGAAFLATFKSLLEDPVRILV